MKRSTIIAIIIIFISIIGGGLLGFYFYINSSSRKEAVIGTRLPINNSFGSPSVNTSISLSGNASTTNQTNTPLITTENTPNTVMIPVLRKIYGDPVSGAGFFIKDIFATSSAVTETILVANGTSTDIKTNVLIPAKTRLIGKLQTIRFVERANGHIYETATSTLELVKTSNTTISKIYEALFVTKDSLLLRGLYGSSDTISTLIGREQILASTSTEKTLLTKELDRDLKQLALSPSKNKIFTLQNSSPTGRISNPDGSGSVSVFDSEFKEWLISWPTEKLITLTTKASAFVEGFMYSVDTTSRNMQKIIGNRFGLTTNMSPDGQKVIYSESISESTYLSVYDLSTKTSRPLFFRTFAEKCIWSNSSRDIVFCAVPENIATGDYPDIWYLGLISFSDNVWKINIKTGETKLIANLFELGKEKIDAVNLVLNNDDSYLVFNNKIDLSFWGLKLVADIIATSTPNVLTASTTKP